MWPITQAVSKQLRPVFDKPVIHCPLSTLVTAKIREIMVLTSPEGQSQFQRLPGDGTQWRRSLTYGAQPRPEGIAQAFVIARELLNNGPAALILGDIIFHGVGLGRKLTGHTNPAGAEVFGCPVADPSAYGVVEFDEAGQVLPIEEKSASPKSRYAVPGLYFYDSDVVEIAEQLTPRGRGEWEISSINQEYLRRGALSLTLLDRGTAWLDTDTFARLVQAGQYVRVIEERPEFRIRCVEEAAWRAGFLADNELCALAGPLTRSGYGDYLLRSRDWKSPIAQY